MNKKLRKFKKNEEKKQKTANRKSITEQFTLQGFFNVSLWGILISIMTFPVLDLLGNLGLEIEFNWKWCSIIYLISWLISFWIFCLSPKLNNEE